MGPLHDVKILELGGIGPGPFAGMVLSDMGAEVVRIDRAVATGRMTGTDRVTGLKLSIHALLPWGRDELYSRLDRRFDVMMDAGLLDEVRSLHARGDLDPDLPSLRTVGYRQLWAHLEGRLTFSEAVAAAKKATRNLAKRQLTWLRSEPALEWIAGVENSQLAPIKSVLCDAASPSRTGSL